MTYLITNTAVKLAIGPFLDASDGVTPELAVDGDSVKGSILMTGDTGAAVTRVALAMGDTAGDTNGLVHISGDSNGWYSLNLSAANTNRFGSGYISLANHAVFVPIMEPIFIMSSEAFTRMKTGIVEGAFTHTSAARAILALNTGKSDGGGGDTIHYRDTGDTINRLTFTVDSNGNRTAVTRNLG